MQPWKTSIHVFFRCKIRIWSILRLLWRLKIYLCWIQNLGIGVRAIHMYKSWIIFRKSHHISNREQNYCTIKLQIVKKYFQHFIWLPFSQTNTVVRVTIVHVPEWCFFSTQDTSDCFSSNQCKSQSFNHLWGLLFSTDLFTIHSAPSS